MSEYRVARHRPREEPPWRRATGVGPQHHRAGRDGPARRTAHAGGDRRAGGLHPPAGRARPGSLTTLGVSLVLSCACLVGALLDLVLVHTADWALTSLYLMASCYAAARVRRTDWYSAVVGPPLAFALGLTLVAAASKHDFGSGLLGTAATMLELLALKARAVYLGTALAAAITLVRRLRSRR